jgi:hypothetical protein
MVQECPKMLLLTGLSSESSLIVQLFHSIVFWKAKKESKASCESCNILTTR